MRLSLAAARKYVLIICMRLLAVISMRLLTVLWRTRAIYWIHGKHGKSRGKSIWRGRCVPDRECCRRSPYLQDGTIPYCLRGPSTYMWRQKRWPFCCVPSGAGLSRLFAGRLAIQGSLESGASARAIFVTHEHKSTNLTRVTSVCAS